MKRLRNLLLAFILISMTGCRSQTPSLTYAERIEGIYRLQIPRIDDEVRDIQVRTIGGTVLIEHRVMYENAYETYWVSEIHPDDGTIVYSSQTEEISGLNLSYSGLSNGGQYWLEAADITIIPLDDSIMLKEDMLGDISEYTYKKLDDATDFHEPSPEQLQYLSLNQADHIDQELIGEWYFDNGTSEGYLSLQDDGALIYAFKEDHLPMKVCVGQWGVHEDHTYVTWQRIDYGSMPYMGNYEWSIVDGVLYMTVDLSGEELLDGSLIALQRADEPFVFDNDLFH